MDDREQRLRTLANEYINYINLMVYTDVTDEDRRYLSAQRTLAHDELIRMTGLARPFDMAQYCSDLLAGRARVILVPA